MGTILIDQIRISGFRGLDDFEMSLTPTTVLTGTNNTGKTTILKALQLSLGSRSFLSIDDLYISKDNTATEIIIDIRIIAIDTKGHTQTDFPEEWEEVFTSENIRLLDDISCVPVRTVISYNSLKSSFDIQQKILVDWLPSDGNKWQDITAKNSKIDFSKTPFFYIEAQRDVIDDMKLKTSYLGKMLSDVAKAYNMKDLEDLENLISTLNQQAVEKSDILSTIQSSLEDINSAMDKRGSEVIISPFTKKIRDLNKGVSIHYGNSDNSFTMDYHGMGTRSWSSLLTFKAFVLNNARLARIENEPFFPIIAIEEPEAHLHPNAQKKLYRQMHEMPGQKIISTHSPYVASSANLGSLRGLYKDLDKVFCGIINLSEVEHDDQRKLKQKIINTRGEILFSKAIILFEGETEEQALPIIAEKYFGCPASELGINFIGVGGAGNYFPFLQFAQSFNIPWYIFSDGEDDPVAKMTAAIKKIRKDNFTTIQDEENVFIIDQKDDFEKYIIRLGYIDDIKRYIKETELPKCVNEQHRESKSKGIDFVYTNSYVLSESKNDKTKWALIFAYAIYHSSKSIPLLVSNMLDKIKEDLHYDK